MSDCGCDKTKAELEEFIHNELVRENASDVQDHIENCTDCSGEHKVGIVLTEAVRRACNESAPEDLREQVLSTLRREHEAHEAAVAASGGGIVGCCATTSVRAAGLHEDKAKSDGSCSCAPGGAFDAG